MNPKPSDNASAHALSNLIKELMALLTQGATGDSLAIMAEADLTLPQIVTLQALLSGGARNVSGIAALLNLSRPAASHLVERLVMRKLVGRSEDPTDRRQKVVQITPEGAALMNRLNRSRSGEFETAISRLPEQLQGEFAVVLAEVVSRLRAETGARDHTA